LLLCVTPDLLAHTPGSEGPLIRPRALRATRASLARPCVHSLSETAGPACVPYRLGHRLTGIYHVNSSKDPAIPPSQGQPPSCRGWSPIRAPTHRQVAPVRVSAEIMPPPSQRQSPRGRSGLSSYLESNPRANSTKANHGNRAPSTVDCYRHRQRDLLLRSPKLGQCGSPTTSTPHLASIIYTQRSAK